MAFTFAPVPPRKQRQPVSFETARARMVANLGAELDRFIEQGRNTRHIKRFSPSETVFIFSYGTQQAIQAKVTCGPRQTLTREADRRAYQTGTARLAAARKRRSNRPA
jgi:hypothetical protein